MQERNVNPIYTQWLEGLDDEIGYWAKWIKTRGWQWPEEFEVRMQQRRELCIVNHLLPKISQMPSQDIKVLDVGSGPMTIIGRYEEKNLQITACDPLADAYNDLMEKYGVEPHVRPVFADCENLSIFFEHNYFDAVLCHNALDHSYNPLQGILQMTQVVKSGGCILLHHYENVAVLESYRGLHQWNFTIEDNDFIIWNRESRFSLRETLGSKISISVAREGVFISCLIEMPAQDEALHGKVEFDIHLKYKAAMGQLIRSRVEPVVKVAEEELALEKKLEEDATPKRWRGMKRKLLGTLGFKRYRRFINAD